MTFPGLRAEPILVGHLKGFVDFTPRANFEVGLNYVQGNRTSSPPHAAAADLRPDCRSLGLRLLTRDAAASRGQSDIPSLADTGRAK